MIGRETLRKLNNPINIYSMGVYFSQSNNLFFKS